jgi:hypothetical protein
MSELIFMVMYDNLLLPGIFLFTIASRPALGLTQPPTQQVPGALSLEVRRWGREADHSPPSSAEVKNACSYTSTPQHAFMAWCNVKAQGQLLPLPYFKHIQVKYFYKNITQALMCNFR